MKTQVSLKGKKTVGRHASEKILSLLKSELTRRFQKNPRYSLRSFSNSFGIDQSLLSKILKGERDLSFPMVLKLGQTVGLTLEEIQTLVSKNLPSTHKSYKFLDEEQFLIISGWYHFAILELMQTTGFKPNPSWIAKRLSISVNEVQFALERLEKNGFIQKITSRRWVCLEPSNSWFNGKHTSSARRDLQQQLLDRAKDSITNVAFENRENASLTIAVSTDLLPEIKKRIHKFKDEINELAMSYGKQNEVYQTCIAFFPLTTKEDRK